MGEDQPASCFLFLSPASCLGTRHGVLLLLCLTTVHTFVSGVTAAGKFSILSISQPALRKPTGAGQPPKIALGMRKDASIVQTLYNYNSSNAGNTPVRSELTEGIHARSRTASTSLTGAAGK